MVRERSVSLSFLLFRGNVWRVNSPEVDFPPGTGALRMRSDAVFARGLLRLLSSGIFKLLMLSELSRLFANVS